MGYIPAAATVAASLIGSAGQYAANQKVLQQQQRNNDVSINLANTAHQREVQDLLAAGLNPVLSTSGSGASVPSLGVANQENELSSLSSGMTSAARLQALDIPLKVSQTELNSAQAEKASSDAYLAEVQANAVRHGLDALENGKSWLDNVSDTVGDWIGTNFLDHGNSARSVPRGLHPSILRKQFQDSMREYEYDLGTLRVVPEDYHRERLHKQKGGKR